MKKFIFITLFIACSVFSISFCRAEDDDYGSFDGGGGGGSATNPRTLGLTVYGSVQLVDTLPVLDPGVGGGAWFDYRFNDRFSLSVEAFAITQDGDGRSQGEGDIQFLGLPTTTLKLYFLNAGAKFDPYAGIGIGIYVLTEGAIPNNSFGMGLGAQFETGFDYLLSDSFVASFGGVYRSVGLLNGLSGTSNATTYMPYTLFGRLGYKF